MFRKSLKALFAVLIVLFIASPLMADNAKITYVKGKVEVNKNGTWTAVKVGDLISENETVSTGYQSEARLNLNGTVLAVAAMSRVKIETLKSEDKKDTVSVYVDAGATRSKVTHADNKKIDYTTRTAVAVASVRGTDYMQTARGLTICYEGAVAIYSASDWLKAVVAKGEIPTEEEIKEAIENGETDLPPEVLEIVEDIIDGQTPPAEEVIPGSATANTPAKEISNSAPMGAYVIGAGQRADFDEDGKPTAPSTQIQVKRRRIVSGVKTAAEKENTAYQDSITQTKTPTTAVVNVTVTIE